MLQFEIAKRNGGFVLWGDYGTLKPIHSFLMDISEQSPVLHKEGLLPALAYDIRKAYEGFRKKETLEVWNDDVAIYGVEQVWPTFINQIALARSGLAFVNSSKDQQSTMYLLEAFLEDAVKNAFPKESNEILDVYNQLTSSQEQFITDVLGGRVAYFLYRDAKSRRSELIEVLKSLNPMWASIVNAIGNERAGTKLSPKDFEGYSWESLDNISDSKYKL